MMLERLRQMVERSDTPIGRRFTFFIQTLIVLSLVSFSVETLPNLTPLVQNFLRWVEVGTVAIFTGEYLLKIFVAERKFRFIFSFSESLIFSLYYRSMFHRE